MTAIKYPLEGIRVVDFSRMLAGPYLTMNLADLGAEVLKIEERGKGDDTRGFPPHAPNGQSSFFVGTNRSKRSITIDLKKPEGREVVRELILQADILVENFRAGVMARYGFDYEALHAIHPRLIYCSITGYGHTSPLREVGGYDPVAQAESGLMALTGYPEGDPVRAGGGLIDSLTGAVAGNAVLAALIARGSTGKGQFVDISLLDSALAALSSYGQSVLDTGKNPKRMGNSTMFMAPMNTYQCADGPVYLIAASNRQFDNLCNVVFEAPELAEDPRFNSIANRIRNIEALEEILIEYLGKHDRQYWIDRMRPTGIVVGNVRTLSDALSSPEVIARGMVVDVGIEGQGGYSSVGSPFFFSDTKVREPEPAPLLGADTDAVLAEVLDYSPSRIKELRDKGAVGE